MAVFSKGNPAPRAPRCEVQTARGRCKFRGERYVSEDGKTKFCCGRHAAILEKKGSAK